MAITDDQWEFLQELDRGAADEDDFDKERRAKDAALERAQMEIARVKNDLRAGMDFSVTDTGGLFGQAQTIETMDQRGQMASLEARNIRDTTQLPPDQERKARKALDDVLKQVRQLQELKTDDGIRVMTDEEIRQEFIEPLIREGLVADTFLPASFSPTQHFTDSVMGYYQEGVQEAQDLAEQKQSKQMLAEMSGGTTAAKAKAKRYADSVKQKLETEYGRWGKELAMVGAKVYNAEKSVVAAELMEMTVVTANPLKEAEHDLAAAGQVGWYGYKVYDSTDKKKKIKEQSQRETLAARAGSAARRIIDALAGTNADVLGEVDPEAGRTVELAYRSVAQANDLAAYLQAQPPKVQQAVELLAGAYAQAFKLGKPREPAFIAVGDAVSAAFCQRANPDIFTRALNAGEPASAADALVKAGTAALRRALAIGQVEEADDPGGPPAADADAFKQALGDAQVRDQMRGQVDDRLQQDAEADLQREREDMNELRRKLTQMDDGGAAMADERSILVLIGKLQEEERLFQLAQSVLKGLGSGGTEIAQAVQAGGASEAVWAGAQEALAPLRALGCIPKLMSACLAAADRRRMWLSMKGQLLLAIKAGSLVTPAIENFVRNQRRQFTYQSIQAILNFVQLVALITKMTGFAAPIAEAVQRTAAAAATVTDAIYEQIGLQELKEAWLVTKLALDNPDNRQLNLRAHSLNATLAKYAIAYAAIEQRDPIARSVLSECGLNETTLEQRDAGVRNVQLYLQTRFKDDAVVDGTESNLKGELVVNWQLKPVELTTACWLKTIRRAETKARPPLAPEKPAEIETALRAVEKGEAQRQADPNAAVAPQHVNNVKKLVAAFANYLPRKADRYPHAEMQEVVDEFRAKAERLLAELEAQRQPAAGGDGPQPPPEQVAAPDVQVAAPAVQGAAPDEQVAAPAAELARPAEPAAGAAPPPNDAAPPPRSEEAAAPAAAAQPPRHAPLTKQQQELCETVRSDLKDFLDKYIRRIPYKNLADTSEFFGKLQAALAQSNDAQGLATRLESLRQEARASKGIYFEAPSHWQDFDELLEPVIRDLRRAK